MMLGRLRCVGQSSQGNTPRKMARKCQLYASPSDGKKSLSSWRRSILRAPIGRSHLRFKRSCGDEGEELSTAPEYGGMSNGTTSIAAAARSFACAFTLLRDLARKLAYGVDAARPHAWTRNCHVGRPREEHLPEELAGAGHARGFYNRLHAR
jgi:hypothetical protein